MKKAAFILAASLAVSAPLSLPAMDHDAMHHHDHDMMDHGTVVHEETIDGVKAVFKASDMKDAMHGAELPKGMKETHHIMAAFRDAKTGATLAEGDVKMKIQGPDKREQVKDLIGMEGHFGADFDLSKKGKYGVMVKFKLGDKKVRTAKFRYEAE